MCGAISTMSVVICGRGRPHARTSCSRTSIAEVSTACAPQWRDFRRAPFGLRLREASQDEAMMQHVTSPRRHQLMSILLVLTASSTLPAFAQTGYFGRNRVQHETFQFEVLKTDHF